MDRVFLDANVLFSAAYLSDSGLLQLWELEDVELITSFHALEEARRNLDTPERRDRLEELARELSMAAEASERPLPSGIRLPDKDRPILLAAIEAGASHLVTGDVTDFGPYFGRRVEGVLILRPAEYLRSRRGG